MANIRSLLQNLHGTYRKKVTPELEAIARAAHKETLDYIIDRVLEHKVSQELMNHTYPSSFFASPKGTLFGFMGFIEGEDPVGDLIDFLNENVKFELDRGFIKTLTAGVFGVSGSILIPSKRELADGLTIELDWGDGRSWPDRLEGGIDGIPSFFSGTYGRSQEGFQVKHEFNNRTELGKIPYLSNIFAGARKKFRENLRKNSRKLK